MKTVWKYGIPANAAEFGWFERLMPKDAKIVAVQDQDGWPVMWAVVDSKQSEVVRKFKIVGTGHDAGMGELEHLGTWQAYGGRLVFHLFEVIGIWG